MISTVAPSRHFGMRHRGEVAAKLLRVRHTSTVGNVKISLSERHIIVASTCRCSAQFGMLRNLSLNDKLCLRDVRNAAFFLEVHHLLPL